MDTNVALNQAIFSGSRETASTLLTLSESRELIRKERNYAQKRCIKSSYF
jgi:hypothetical protein